MVSGFTNIGGDRNGHRVMHEHLKSPHSNINRGQKIGLCEAAFRSREQELFPPVSQLFEKPMRVLYYLTILGS